MSKNFPKGTDITEAFFSPNAREVFKQDKHASYCPQNRRGAFNDPFTTLFSRLRQFEAQFERSGGFKIDMATTYLHFSNLAHNKQHSPVIRRMSPTKSKK